MSNSDWSANRTDPVSSDATAITERVTMTDEEARRLDRSFRWRLAGGAACWAIVGVTNLVASWTWEWYPSLVGILALACAACTAVLALRPAAEWAYRWGGTLAVGALAMRAVAVIETELRVENPDFVWVMLGQMAITALLAGTYAWSWLHDVKTWHRAHRIMGH
jgi:hypothetical protein